MWRAAARLGIGAEAAAPAVEAGLVEFGARVRFRHPLVRSAVYGSAPPQERQQVHGALAEVTDPELDPDRRAWHRAHAAPGPDEAVAADLVRCADRAQARGGLAAAAAFLERATMLTLDPKRRAERALAAASANLQAGAFDTVRQLLSLAEAGAITDLQQARIDLLAADLAFVTNRGSDAPSLLLKAAKRLEPIDARAVARDLPAGIFGRDVDRSPGPRRWCAGGGARRRGRTAAAGRNARLRPSAGRPGSALRQGI